MKEIEKNMPYLHSHFDPFDGKQFDGYRKLYKRIWFQPPSTFSIEKSFNLLFPDTVCVPVVATRGMPVYTLPRLGLQPPPPPMFGKNLV